MKDPIEVRPPSRDRLLIALGVENPRCCITSALLDDLPFDLCHRPVIESRSTNKFKLQQRPWRMLNSRRQLADRLTHRTVKFAQQSPV